MLGLLLIYFIGRKFYDLAGLYDKSQWGFAIFGVIAYYFGTFVAGIIFVILNEFYGSTPTDELNDYALGLMALPFGLLSCWGLYMLLKKQWKDKPIPSHYDILDEELPE